MILYEIALGIVHIKSKIHQRYKRWKFNRFATMGTHVLVEGGQTYLMMETRTT